MDTIKSISVGMLQGFYDSIKGIVLVFYIDNQMNKIVEAATTSSTQRIKIRKHGPDGADMSSVNTAPKEETMEPKIMNRIFKNCALNGGFAWLSVYIFEYVLLCLETIVTFIYGNSDDFLYIWSWLHWFLSLMFNTMWLVPIFLLSRIVSSLWFSDIADLAYRYRRGRPQPIQSISRVIADNLFSILVETLFLFQAMLVCLLPNYFGMILHCVHLCLLHSLYAFEYKWYNMGWELHKRLSFIECNWPYFIGFGMPLTILISLPEAFIIRCCVFSLLFPIFILSANEAQPIIGSCDYPLRLFSPVIALSNIMFSKPVKAQRPTTANARVPTPVRRSSPSHLRSR